MAALTSPHVPGEDNVPFWHIIDALVNANANQPLTDMDLYANQPLTDLDLSGRVRELMSAWKQTIQLLQENNQPVRSLVDGITRAVNEEGNGDGEWTSVDLSGVPEVILPLVSKSGLAMAHASDALKADREVVMAACNQSGIALFWASDELKADREVVMAACNQEGMALRCASDALKADREVVIAACKQNGIALSWVSDALKADREVVMAACNQDGMSLRYASDELKADREVVIAACNQNGIAFAYASCALHDNDMDNDEVVRAAASKAASPASK